jgi:hypothetical protein
MLGIRISEITRSTFSFSSTAKPSSPPLAINTSYPLVRNNRRKELRIFCSSSTHKIRGLSGFSSAIVFILFQYHLHEDA